MAGVAEVRDTRTTHTPPGAPPPCSAAISALELRLAVELGRVIVRVSDLLDLRPGSVVRLDRPADGPVVLTVAGRSIGRGEVMVIDDVLAIRVTDILGTGPVAESEGNAPSFDVTSRLRPLPPWPSAS